MKNLSKKIAVVLAAIMFVQPAMFALDTALTKEIVALELELTKMKTHAGEYANMSEAALNRKIERTKKKLKKIRTPSKKAQRKQEKILSRPAKTSAIHSKKSLSKTCRKFFLTLPKSKNSQKKNMPYRSF